MALYALAKKYRDSEISSENGKYRLYFKPVTLVLNDNDKSGIYLIEVNGGVSEQLLFSSCGREFNWHEAECNMLSKVDSLDIGESDRECIRKLIWDAIVGKTREEFENEESAY